MCGGTGRSDLPLPGMPGLSPRVRGNPAQESLEIAADRSIPACAGEPFRLTLGGTVDKVYPRVCGGTDGIVRGGGGGGGLSPRVRGNLPVSLVLSDSVRSIPACAGEPHGQAHRLVRGEVYPRVCGGTWRYVGLGGTDHGLSPRVRGNPRCCRAAPTGPGSIPACAGEPCSRPAPGSRRWVYPRVCGGTAQSAQRGGTGSGLSPRVRGNRLWRLAQAGYSRSIPACAGEPVDLGCPRIGGAVYPRVCGGTSASTLPHSTQRGLSPRVRGNPTERDAISGSVRSIPACAGEPPLRSRTILEPGVYPRVCGGTRYAPDGGRRPKGLSPRVRGNL